MSSEKSKAKTSKASRTAKKSSPGQKDVIDRQDVDDELGDRELAKVTSFFDKNPQVSAPQASLINTIKSNRCASLFRSNYCVLVFLLWRKDVSAHCTT